MNFFLLIRHHTGDFENIIYSCMQSTSVNMFSANWGGGGGGETPPPPTLPGRLPPHSEIWRILLITFVGEWGFAKCLLFVLATTFSNNTFPFFLFYLLIVITMRLNSVKLRVLIRYYLCFLFFVLQSLVVENIFDKIWGKKT